MGKIRDQYRFASYTEARIEKRVVTENTISLVFSDRKERLEINAKQIDGGHLKAPTFTQMDRRISEILSSGIDLILSAKKSGTWHQVFENGGCYAGLELVGKL